MQQPLATTLYWQSLPTPSEFKSSIAKAMEEGRVAEVYTNRFPVTGMRKAIEEGIRAGFTEHQKIVFLNIGKGQDIAAEIGAHCGRHAGVTASLLAMEDFGLAAVVLFPDSGNAASACREYLAAFKNAIKTAGGMTRLAVVFESDSYPIADPDAKGNSPIVFDGMLSYEEMRAYVSVRMVQRVGSSGSPLLQSLVTEFAGFDPMFAETLMSLDNDQILSLPASLETLFQHEPLRWRENKWGLGCVSLIAGKEMLHTMRQYHISKHSSAHKSLVDKGLKDARWRACINALLPWLEIERGRVIGILRPKLLAVAKENNGKLEVGKDYKRLIDVDDVEFGQLTYFIKNRSIFAGNDLERSAMNFCWSAKKVRDEIAHLRAPDAALISSLMRDHAEMERKM